MVSDTVYTQPAYYIDNKSQLDSNFRNFFLDKQLRDYEREISDIENAHQYHKMELEKEQESDLTRNSRDFEVELRRMKLNHDRSYSKLVNDHQLSVQAEMKQHERIMDEMQAKATKHLDKAHKIAQYAINDIKWKTENQMRANAESEQKIFARHKVYR